MSPRLVILNKISIMVKVSNPIVLWKIEVMWDLGGNSQVDRYKDYTYPEYKLFLQVTSLYYKLTNLNMYHNM